MPMKLQLITVKLRAFCHASVSPEADVEHLRIAIPEQQGIEHEDFLERL